MKTRDPLSGIKEIEGRNGTKYRINEKIGEGGVGVVYKVTANGKNYALKVMDPRISEDLWGNVWKRFILEGQRGQKLIHDNVIKICDCGICTAASITIDRENKGRPFFVMEYIDSTLENFITNNPLLFSSLRGFMEQITKGLAYIHSQPDSENTDNCLVHRDIKPVNILIESKKKAVIADLGIVKWGVLPPVTTSGVLGTWDFMAPEQRVCSAKVTLKADIFALGLTFVYMITKKIPNRDGILAGRNLAIEELKNNGCPYPMASCIINKMLAIEPDERPDTKEVLSVLAGDGIFETLRDGEEILRDTIPFDTEGEILITASSDKWKFDTTIGMQIWHPNEDGIVFKGGYYRIVRNHKPIIGKISYKVMANKEIPDWDRIKGGKHIYKITWDSNGLSFWVDDKEIATFGNKKLPERSMKFRIRFKADQGDELTIYQYSGHYKASNGQLVEIP